MQHAALAAETAPPAGAQSAAADAAATEAAAEEAPSDTSGNTGRVAEAENRMVQPAASSASPAVPAVQGQAQTLVSSMVESAKKQEREVAEALVAPMGKECQLDTTLVLLSQVTGWIEEAALAMEASEGAAAALAAETAPPAGAQSAAMIMIMIMMII